MPAALVPTPAEVIALGERGYFIRDGLAGDAAARAAHAAATRLVDAGALRPAGVSRQGVASPEIRADLITFLDESALDVDFDGVVDALKRLQAGLREHAWLVAPRRELQLACYPGGGAGYVRHRDAFRTDNPVGNRRVTCVHYLNPSWREGDGGELRLWTGAGDDDVIDVAPVLDRVVVFMSEVVEHAVLPTDAPRFALTAWLSPC